jgi:hypothetical protein
MSTFYAWIIRKLCQWLYGITADQWKAALGRVTTLLTDETMTGEQKRQEVQAAARAAWPKLATSAINWLIETALGAAKKKAGIQ